MRNISRNVCHALLVISLSGCGATLASQQSEVLNTNATAVKSAYDACGSAVYASKPEFRSILARVPIERSMTLRQMVDDGYASPADVETMLTLTDELAPCRDKMVEDTGKAYAPLAPLFAAHFRRDDMILADLVRRRVTYGQAARALDVAKQEDQAKFDAIAQQLANQLAADDQAERAQRAETAAAVASAVGSIAESAAQAYGDHLQYKRDMHLINAIYR